MGTFTKHGRIFDLLGWLVWRVNASYYLLLVMTNEQITCFERVESMENRSYFKLSISHSVLCVYVKTKKVAPRSITETVPPA